MSEGTFRRKEKKQGGREQEKMKEINENEGMEKRGLQDSPGELGGEDRTPGGGDGTGEAPGEGGGGAGETREERLAREVSALEQEKEELMDRLLRLQADFDNFRKRSQAQQEQVACYAAAELVKCLLPVMDNFERALASGGHKEGYRAGVEMIFKQLGEVLEKQGLEPVETAGKEFDPYVHEAFMQVEADGYQENMVVEELQKGYKFKDRLIRPSLVKVAK